MKTKILAAIAGLLLLASASASFADNECVGANTPPGFNCFGKN